MRLLNSLGKNHSSTMCSFFNFCSWNILSAGICRRNRLRRLAYMQVFYLCGPVSGLFCNSVRSCRIKNLQAVSSGSPAKWGEK